MELVALKIDKLNGDIRTAFDIIHHAILKKIAEINEKPTEYLKCYRITYDDVNYVITEMYKSKT